MSEHKDEIYLLIIWFLVILAVLMPVINSEINSKEECVKEGSITMCREVYTRVTTDWHIKTMDRTASSPNGDKKESK